MSTCSPMGRSQASCFQPPEGSSWSSASKSLSSASLPRESDFFTGAPRSSETLPPQVLACHLLPCPEKRVMVKFVVKCACGAISPALSHSLHAGRVTSCLTTYWSESILSLTERATSLQGHLGHKKQHPPRTLQ